MLGWVIPNSRRSVCSGTTMLPNRSALSFTVPSIVKVALRSSGVRMLSRSPTVEVVGLRPGVVGHSAVAVSPESVAGEPSSQSRESTSATFAGSIPDTRTSLSWRSAPAKLSEETVRTPSTRSASRPAPALIGEKPSEFCRTRSPWKLRSIALPTDALMPAANTVTNTTTASPIISAPAVTAVRPGLRTEFSRASRPVIPRSFSSGQPATEARGRTRRGLSIDTPISVTTAPPPARPAPAFASSTPRTPRRRSWRRRRASAAPRRRRRSGRAAALRQLGLEQRRHGRNAGGSQGGKQRREEGDEQAHNEREDDRAGGDDRAGVGQVDAEVLKMALSRPRTRCRRAPRATTPAAR